MAKAKRKKRAQVFCVPAGETASGKHEVIYAKDGDLNKGEIKRFSDWMKAEGFAHEKGKELEAEVMIHKYRLNPTYRTRYKRVPKRSLPRITPKTPRLRR